MRARSLMFGVSVCLNVVMAASLAWLLVTRSHSAVTLAPAEDVTATPIAPVQRFAGSGPTARKFGDGGSPRATARPDGNPHPRPADLAQQALLNVLDAGSADNFPAIDPRNDAAIDVVRACRRAPRPEEPIVATLHRPEGGGADEIEVLSGAANTTERRCMLSALQALPPEIHELEFTTLQITGAGRAWTMRSADTPPMTEAALDWPNVDPRDVAETCVERGDDGCVIRALGRLPELQNRDRTRLMQAHTRLGNAAEIRALLAALPADRLDDVCFAPYQAWLWRVEHRLPLGEASDLIAEPWLVH